MADQTPKREQTMTRSLASTKKLRGCVAVVLGCGVLSAGVATAAAPSPPKLVSAHLFNQTGVGLLKPGTVVSPARLGVRVFPNATHGFALALVRNVTYPAATTNGGHTWRIDGPALHLPAAQAPLVVTQVGATNPNTYFAWGGPEGGNVVDVTPDGGKHWWQAFLGGSLLSVVATSNHRLIATVQVPTGPQGKQTANFVYVSRDRGRHWHLNTSFL
jgi:hypothetical protein